MKPVPSLPEEELAAMKQQFDELLLGTYREGVEELIAWLEEETDFYIAPASTANHGAVAGGLLRHSLSVQRYLSNFIKPIKEQIPEESAIIASLLHDLCKANFYGKRVRNVKVDGRWEEQESFYIEDQFPFGHGEKSALLAQRFIDLTDDEALAIRWHMGGFDDAARGYAGGLTQASAYNKCKLAVALNVADMYVANIIGH